MRSALLGLATIPSHFRYLRWLISTSEADVQLSDWKCKKKKIGLEVLVKSQSFQKSFNSLRL